MSCLAGSELIRYAASSWLELDLTLIVTCLAWPRVIFGSAGMLSNPRRTYLYVVYGAVRCLYAVVRSSRTVSCRKCPDTRRHTTPRPCGESMNDDEEDDGAAPRIVMISSNQFATFNPRNRVDDGVSKCVGIWHVEFAEPNNGPRPNSGTSCPSFSNGNLLIL